MAAPKKTKADKKSGSPFAGIKLAMCEGTMVPLSDLNSWPGNPRVLPENRRASLTKQLTAMGLFRPFLVWHNGEHFVVLGGNQRFLLLQEMLAGGAVFVDDILGDSTNGMVPCTILPASMTKARAKEIVIADNNPAGEWDYTGLRNMLADEDVLDITLLGFEDDLAESLRSLSTDPEALVNELAGNDDDITIPVDPDTGSGDAWSHDGTDGEPEYDPNELVGFAFGPQRHKVRAETYHRFIVHLSQLAGPDWSFDKTLNKLLDDAGADMAATPDDIDGHRKDHGTKTTPFQSAGKKPAKKTRATKTTS